MDEMKIHKGNKVKIHKGNKIDLVDAYKSSEMNRVMNVIQVPPDRYCPECGDIFTDNEGYCMDCECDTLQIENK